MFLLPCSRPVHHSADNDLNYMSKCMCRHGLVLSNQRLVRPVANDEFFIFRDAPKDMCLCYQKDV